MFLSYNAPFVLEFNEERKNLSQKIQISGKP